MARPGIVEQPDTDRRSEAGLPDVPDSQRAICPTLPRAFADAADERERGLAVIRHDRRFDAGTGFTTIAANRDSTAFTPARDLLMASV